MGCFVLREAGFFIPLDFAGFFVHLVHLVEVAVIRGDESHAAGGDDSLEKPLQAEINGLRRDRGGDR